MQGDRIPVDPFFSAFLRLSNPSVLGEAGRFATTGRTRLEGLIFIASHGVRFPPRPKALGAPFYERCKRPKGTKNTAFPKYTGFFSGIRP